jgi:hypothetical protein
MDESLALQQLDDKTLAPPKESRVGSASAIRGRIKDMRRNEQKRASNRRKIQRLIDGARPYDQGQLDSTGQGDRTNFNPREAEGMADAAKTPFYAVRFRSSRFTNIQSDYGDQIQRRAEWGETISNAFHQMLDEWDEHDYNTQLYQWQMCVFGVGMSCGWMKRIGAGTRSRLATFQCLTGARPTSRNGLSAHGEG